MKTVSLSLEGAAFIGAFEGFVPTCYDDGSHAGAGNCTIGFGHLVHYGPTTTTDRRKWGSLTRAQAAALLQHDAQAALLGIERHVTVALTAAQRDALCSFAYNCGAEALAGSVGAAVNSKPRRWRRTAIAAWHRRVAATLAQWDHAGGAVNPGLLRRRRAEAVLFATGAYTRPRNPFAN